MEDNQWIEIFLPVPSEKLDLLESILLYDCGLTGLIIHDDDFKVFLDTESNDWDYVAEDLVEEKDKQETGITFYLRENVHGNDQLNQIKTVLSQTRKDNNDVGNLEIQMKNIAEADWANNWKKYFKPFPVGEKIMIKPSWEEIKDDIGERVILNIDPAHVFGTGTHETTKLCLQLVEKYVDNVDKLLDIGCGSGILSIGGLLLGVGNAEAVDIDPNAIDIAYANSDRNSIPRGRYNVISGNILDDESVHNSYKGKEYDLVIANIVADIIIELTKKVPEYIKSQGVFICSGIITDRREDVENALVNAKFEILEVEVDKDWVAIATRYKG